MEHTRGWYAISSQPNVLTVVYEKMKKNPRGELIRIGEFLGGIAAERVKDDVILDDILEKTTVSHMKDRFNRQFSDHMKKVMKKDTDPDHESGDDDNETGSQKISDKDSFIRKGEVGDWVNYSNEELEQKFQAWIDSDPRNKAVMKLFDD